jgi:hypothetical protein
VRNALAYATHKFFQDNGFVWVSSPIITASDCEGAGEQFYVTTLVSFLQYGYLMHSTILLLYRKCSAHFCQTESMLHFYVAQIFQWSLCSKSETMQPNELHNPAIIILGVHMLQVSDFFDQYSFQTALKVVPYSKIFLLPRMEGLIGHR